MPSEINYYDATARNYNELHGEEQLNKLKIIAEHIKIKKSTALLDVGCGTGLSAKVFECKITGIDPSEKLLKQCPFKAIKAGAESIPFPDHSFDVVIAVTSIHNFSDIEQGLKEIKRVGRDCFALTVLKKSRNKEFILNTINAVFSVFEAIDETYDIILICK